MLKKIIHPNITLTFFLELVPEDILQDDVLKKALEFSKLLQKLIIFYAFTKNEQWYNEVVPTKIIRTLFYIQLSWTNKRRCVSLPEKFCVNRLFCCCTFFPLFVRSICLGGKVAGIREVLERDHMKVTKQFIIYSWFN